MPAPKYIPHYTVADYQQWEGDWELWDGIAVAMTPSPFGRHQWVAGQLLTQMNVQLQKAGCENCFAVVETDWVVSKNTVVRPDIAIVCDQFPERFIEATPTLIVEVISDSTAEKDRTAKFDLYEREGVKYYLIVDPRSQRFEGFELLQAGYEPIASQPTLNINLHPNCQLQLAFLAFLAPSP